MSPHVERRCCPRDVLGSELLTDYREVGDPDPPHACLTPDNFVHIRQDGGDSILMADVCARTLSTDLADNPAGGRFRLTEHDDLCVQLKVIPCKVGRKNGQAAQVSKCNARAVT